MEKFAFLFAGQGAQTPGMASELVGLGAVKNLFDMAEKKKPGITDMIFHGTKEDLAVTVNTQPAMYLADLAYAIAKREESGAPAAVCGFSVGEIPALAFAGAIGYEDGFDIVLKRAELMDAASRQTAGTMVAVVGLPREEVEAIAAEAGAWAVNYNAPLQTVVAVTLDKLDALSAAVAARKGRSIRLAVSGAFHCPLLEGAAAELKSFLGSVKFFRPEIPVYANLTAQPYGDDFAGTLSRQMCSPVEFTETVKNMKAAGIEAFYEVGPGQVLTGLVRKINA